MDHIFYIDFHPLVVPETSAFQITKLGNVRVKSNG